MDKYWANKKFEKNWKSPELMLFYEMVVDLIVKRGIDLNSKSVLDAGCGTGSLLIFINKKFKPSESCGYEFSIKAIEIAKDRFPQASYFYKNLNDRPERKFDFIFCTEVIEHILNPHIPVQNLVSMINPGGAILITVPNGRIDTFEGHINFWSPESWKEFIAQYAEPMEIETGQLGSYGLYALIYSKDIGRSF